MEQILVAHGGHEAYFYRTRRGAEMDLLLLRGGRRYGFEFKCSDAPRTTKSMHVVARDLDLDHVWAVYPGDMEYALEDRFTAIPLAEATALRRGAGGGSGRE